MLRHPRLIVARIQPLLVLGRVRARRGDPGALEALDEAWALASSMGELQRMGPVAAGCAEAAWLAGDPARAEGALGIAFDLAVEREDLWTIGELGFWRWRIGAASGPPPGAAEPYALQMQGRAREAAARWRAIGAPYEEALALGDLDDEDALREAHETFE